MTGSGWFSEGRGYWKAQHLLRVSFPKQCAQRVPPSPSRNTWLSAFQGTHPSSLSPYPNSGGLGPTEQFARAQREETLGPCIPEGGRSLEAPEGENCGRLHQSSPLSSGGREAVCLQNTSCWVLPLLNGEMRCQAPVQCRGETFHTPF